MNTTDRHTPSFDAQARRLHQAALSSLEPSTLSRLRAARQAATAAHPARGGRRSGVWLATACSAVLALGVGVHLNRPVPTPASVNANLVASVEGDELLDQNPDLYVWLGSENALAMEQTR